MSGIVLLLLLAVGVVLIWCDYGDSITRKITGRCKHGRPANIFCVDCQQEGHCDH